MSARAPAVVWHFNLVFHGRKFEMAASLLEKLKTYFVVIAATSVVAGMSLMYLCSHKNCGGSITFGRNSTASGSIKFNHHAIVKSYPFNLEGEDIIVFLHMQKTGGTKFGKHLVNNLNIKSPCDCIPKRKKCTCHRPNSDKTWLFSRYSLGWPCGLHADWTELQACVPGYVNRVEGKRKSRKYLYITILREPVARCMSEFRCYQRGATWKTSLHMCNGRVATKEELPPCFTGDNWVDVTLSDFLNCSSNLAFNRQTRMLADLKLVGCYDLSVMPRERRDEILLQSAKRNLESMAYFALVEYQKESQYLFEKTFGMKFRKPFVQVSEEDTVAFGVGLGDEDLSRVQELNYLDTELYSYAKRLFFERLKHFKRTDEEITNTEAI